MTLNLLFVKIALKKLVWETLPSQVHCSEFPFMTFRYYTAVQYVQIATATLSCSETQGELV